jgi:hypothetical protein
MALQKAGYVGGVVVAVPIIADFRSGRGMTT